MLVEIRGVVITLESFCQDVSGAGVADEEDV